MMTPALGKANFTTHVATSVAWLGSVVSFLVLSIAGITSTDPNVVRGAYMAMNIIGAYVIVPLSLAALLSGVVQSLGTPWGLFRQYWVVVKLSLTLGATALLLLHQFTAVAEAARRASATTPDSGRPGPRDCRTPDALGSQRRLRHGFTLRRAGG